ncbi:MAG TPA: YaiO family outer membrane beta-barrel protein [Gemmatimonadales bacterium]
MRSLRGFAVLMLCIAPLRPPPLPAQNPAAGASWIEAGGFYQRVTNGFGDWRGAYGRAVIAGSRNVWYLDARAQEAFRDQGVYGSVANVHTLSGRVYSQLGIGGGTGEFVLPDLRLDASLSVKLGRARRVIATAGATWVDAKSGYRDRSVFGALTWYAPGSVMIEGGSRLTWSNPGNVASARGYGSLSLGRTGSTLVTLRGSAGSEGYQLTGVTQTLNRFDSQEAGVTLRQWMGGSSGLVVGGDWYHNPFYTRSGASVGLFHAW